ncbi:MAG: TolC family protein [Myxococcales bacterium]|jgi:outer membrane protein
MNTPILLLALALQASPLTIEQAVETALSNHPDLRAASSQADSASARARASRGPLLPQVRASASAGYGARDPWEQAIVSNGDLGAAVSADVLLYDFGRTRNQWRSAQASAEATAHSAQAVAADVVLNVRLAFFDVLESEALVRVGRETLANELRHLQQIEQFVEAGTRPAIDLAKLRTTVATARAALVRAESNLQIAKARLNQAMGVTASTDYEVARSSLPPLALEAEATDVLFARAVDNRPELAAQRSSIRASELSVKVAEKRLWPSLQLGAGLSYFADDILAPGWSASLGLTLSWTLFDGLAAPANEEAERANVVTAQARLTGQEQQIWTEVDTALVDLGSAKAELEAARQGLVSARELLSLAEARYAEGVGSSIELSDAQLELSNAEVQVVRGEYDVAAARARLLRAIGERDWS